MFPAAVRQRRVELRWRHGSLAEAISTQRASLHPHGQRWVELPVLGTTAHVDTRAEFYVNQGGPGNRQMVALWTEDGYLLELRAAVPDQAAFEERLGWLTKVDSQTWLDAMPAKVVKAADHDAAVREMLKGIPVPSTFKPSRVPDTGLTTDRYQVGAKVTGTVSCLWFRQWGRPAGPATARRSSKPIGRWRPPSTGRSFAKWRRKAPIPRRSGNWRRTCRAGLGMGAGIGSRCCPSAEAPGVRPLRASRSCRASRSSSANEAFRCRRGNSPGGFAAGHHLSDSSIARS